MVLIFYITHLRKIIFWQELLKVLVSLSILGGNIVALLLVFPPRPARSELGVEVNVELLRDLPAGRHPGSEPEEDGERFVRVVCLDDMLTVSQLFSRFIPHILMCFSVTLLLLTKEGADIALVTASLPPGHWSIRTEMSKL